MTAPARLLLDVIRANAPLLTGSDARGRATAERCVLASADDYASTRWSRDVPADVAAEAEAVRRQCIRRYRYAPADQAARRAELLATWEPVAEGDRR